MAGEETAPLDPLNPKEESRVGYTVFQGMLYNDTEGYTEPDQTIGMNAPEGQKWIGMLLLSEDEHGNIIRYTMSFTESGGPSFRRTS